MQFRHVVEVTSGGATKPALLERLAEHRVSLNEYAEILFASPEFTTSAEMRTDRVAVVSLVEIGLPDGGRYDEIIERAAGLGLSECPLELAVHLRLQLLGQPQGAYLTVASPKLRAEDAFPNGLYLRRLEDGLWLRGYNAGPENTYAPDFSSFAFVCR